MRWADERRGTGKRGGIRVVYLYFEDLTSAQRKEIAGAAQAFKDELQAGG